MGSGRGSGHGRPPARAACVRTLRTLCPSARMAFTTLLLTVTWCNQLYCTANNLLMADLTGAFLQVHVACHVLVMASLPCHMYRPQSWSAYGLALGVHRTFGLYAVMLVLDVLNFGATKTGLQASVFALQHTEALLLVWVLNTRRDRSPLLVTAVVADVVCLVQTGIAYDQLRGTQGVDQNVVLANHALSAFSQLTYLCAVVVALVAKLVRPDDDVLYNPKSDVRVSVTGTTTTTTTTATATATATAFGGSNTHPSAQPHSAAALVVPTALVLACAERVGLGCCVRSCACCRADAADTGDGRDDADADDHADADADDPHDRRDGLTVGGEHALTALDPPLLGSGGAAAIARASRGGSINGGTPGVVQSSPKHAAPSEPYARHVDAERL